MGFDRASANQRHMPWNRGQGNLERRTVIDQSAIAAQKTLGQ